MSTVVAVKDEYVLRDGPDQSLHVSTGTLKGFEQPGDGETSSRCIHVQ